MSVSQYGRKEVSEETNKYVSLNIDVLPSDKITKQTGYN